MSKAYQQRLSDLIMRLGLMLDADVLLEVKPFFGGAAAYANGRICLSLTKVGFALKLPQADRQTLLKLGAQPLRYFPKAPIKREYVIFPDDTWENEKSLRDWVLRSIKYVMDQ